MLIRVVLPAPLGARMPNDCPTSTRNEARSKITLRCVPVQKDFETESNSSIYRPFARTISDPSFLDRYVYGSGGNRRYYVCLFGLLAELMALALRDDLGIAAFGVGMARGKPAPYQERMAA